MAQYKYVPGQVNIHIEPNFFQDHSLPSHPIDKTTIDLKLSDATASTLYSQGNLHIIVGGTSIMATLLGPNESYFARKQKASEAKIEVLLRPGNWSIYGIEQFIAILRELAFTLIQVDQYPKCLIQIILRPIAINGSFLAAACNSLIFVIQRSGILMVRGGKYFNIE